MYDSALFQKLTEPFYFDNLEQNYRLDQILICDKMLFCEF